MSRFLDSRITWGVAGLLAGIFFTLVATVLTVRSAIVQQYRSPYDFTATVDKVVNSANQRGWRVTSHSLEQEPAQEKHADHVQVIHLCNPNLTCDLLALGRNRCVAMIPETVVVYEQKGDVQVAHVNTGALGRFFRREAAGSMRAVRADEREILGFLAKR